MKTHAYIVAGFLLGVLVAAPAHAGLRDVQNLLDARRYAEAHAALEPLVTSGNAQAEQLQGLMYALGLGVPRDLARAFAFYQRAALKGHPGAQADVAWHYEMGLGLPGRDITRAVIWYRLAAMSGDAKAQKAADRLAQGLSEKEIENIHNIVADYWAWFHPSRKSVQP